ncbi:hypothetical protein ACFY7Y_14535 [Streptomyces virginiae]|uniref:hypothetical protein n=1 Tax=Streptomyces virginiae TaxID=1961 RepID=UPI0036A0E6E6
MTQQTTSDQTTEPEADWACGENMCQCSCDRSHACGCDCPRCPYCQQDFEDCDCED